MGICVSVSVPECDSEYVMFNGQFLLYFFAIYESILFVRGSF